MLGRQAVIQAEQEECNETVKSLQFCKQIRHKGENVEEWIKRLRTAATEGNYLQLGRQVKEQFIYGTNEDNLQIKIDLELTAIINASKITSKQVVLWAECEEAWRTHTVETNQLEKQISKTSHADILQIQPPTPKMSNVWQEMW